MPTETEAQPHRTAEQTGRFGTTPRGDKLPLAQQLRRLDDVREKHNLHLPARAIARQYREHTGSDKYELAEKAGIPRHAMARFGTAVHKVGETVGDFLRDTGAPEFVARGSQFLTESAPEAAAVLTSVHPALRKIMPAILATTGAFAGWRGYEQHGRPGLAVAEGASVPMSAVFGMAGHQLARSAARGAGFGATRQAVAGATGGMVTSMPADIPAISIGYPTGARGFFSDPNNALGYLLANTPFAGIDFVATRSNVKAEQAQQRKVDDAMLAADQRLFETTDTAELRVLAKHRGLRPMVDNTAEQIREAVQLVRDEGMKVDDANAWLISHLDPDRLAALGIEAPMRTGVEALPEVPEPKLAERLRKEVEKEHELTKRQVAKRQQRAREKGENASLDPSTPDDTTGPFKFVESVDMENGGVQTWYRLTENVGPFEKGNVVNARYLQSKGYDAPERPPSKAGRDDGTGPTMLSKRFVRQEGGRTLDSLKNRPEVTIEDTTLGDYVRRITSDKDGNQIERLANVAAAFMRALNVGDTTPLRRYVHPHSEAAGYTQRGRINIAQHSEAATAAKHLFSLVTHEATHLALHELRKNNPEAYTALDNFVHQMPMATRKATVAEFSERLSLRMAETYQRYLSGEGFTGPDARLHTTHEFFSGLVEIMAQASFDRATAQQTTIGKLLGALPPSVLAAVNRVVSALRSLFQGALGTTPQMSRELSGAIQRLHGTVLRATDDSTALLHQLELFDSFSPEGIQNSIETGVSPTEGFDYKGVHGDSEIRHLSQRFAEDLTFPVSEPHGQKVSMGWNLLSSMVGATRIMPEVRPVLTVLNQIKTAAANVSNEVLASFGSVGLDGKPQIDQVVRSREHQNYLKRNHKAAARLEKTIDDQQNRLAAQETEVRPDAELVEMFGLNETDLQIYHGMVRAMRDMGQRDIAQRTEDALENTSTYLLFADPTLTSEDVRPFFQAQSDILRTLGTLEHNRVVLLTRERQVKAGARDDVSLVDIAQQLRQEQAIRITVEDQLATRLEARFPELDFRLGDDDRPSPLMQSILNTLTRRGRDITGVELSYRRGGYVPKVRRGRFKVRVWQQNTDGIPTEVSFHGFHKRSDATTFMRKHREKNGDKYSYEPRDTDDAKARFEWMSPLSVEHMQQQAAVEHQNFVRNLESIADVNNPEVAKMLEFVKAEDPLKSSVDDIIAAKGQPFNQRRNNVPGFDPHEYLPNLFDYINIKTAQMARSKARNFAYTELAQGSMQSKPGVAEFTRRLVNYSLSQNRADMALVRKVVFAYYMLGTIKHVTQNLTQPLAVGVGQLQADGMPLLKATETLGVSYGKWFKWKTSTLKWKADEGKRTTGDNGLDQVLARAEFEGDSRPNVLRELAPLEDKRSFVNELSLIRRGEMTLGRSLTESTRRKIYGVYDFGRRFYQFSEQTNRELGMIMGYEYARWRQVKDFNERYRIAQEFNQNINFLGGAASRPGIVQSAAGTPWAHGSIMVAMALRSFVVGQLTQYATFASEGRRGGFDPVTRQAHGEGDTQGALPLPKRQTAFPLDPRVPANRAILTNVLMGATMAGVMGIPFAQDLDELIKSMFGYSIRQLFRRKILNLGDLDLVPYEVDSETGGLVADVAEFGILAFLGIDPGMSLGLGAVGGFRSGDEFNILHLIGPAGGMVESAGKMVNDAGEFNLATTPRTVAGVASRLDQFTKQMQPNFIRQHVEAAKMLVQDQRTTRMGEVIHEGFPLSQRITNFAGWQPKQVTKHRRVYEQERLADQRRKQEQRRAVRDVVDHLQAADHQVARDADPGPFLDGARDAWRSHLSNMPLQDQLSFLGSIEDLYNRGQQQVSKTPVMNAVEDVSAIRAGEPGLSFRERTQTEPFLGRWEIATRLGIPEVQILALRNLEGGFARGVLVDALSAKGIPSSHAPLLLEGGLSNVLRHLQLAQHDQE